MFFRFRRRSSSRALGFHEMVSWGQQILADGGFRDPETGEWVGVTVGVPTLSATFLSREDRELAVKVLNQVPGSSV